MAVHLPKRGTTLDHRPVHRTRSGPNDPDTVVLFTSRLTGTLYGYQRRQRDFGTLVVPMMLTPRCADWVDITNGQRERPDRDMVTTVKTWLQAMYAPDPEDIIWEEAAQ